MRVGGTPSVRVLGLDPGLQHTGWGLIESNGSHLRHLADGVVSTTADLPLGERLSQLFRALNTILELHRPDEAAVEHTYVNKNPGAALKLGQARGVVMLVPSMAGLLVGEYQAMEVKRAVVGTGHADKVQVTDMVKRLLPGAVIRRADAADALAVAICHAHHRASRVAVARMANLAVSQPARS
ncbi:crossover junction endodeoxyribonuclease RuvC [Roseomonas elaeocarpi]|uniref:Crossover junction endodeoxyribonuclease RuvC n=1 Tax=Roseomonas elaeocarpi TaxID=907779 RepID=A0ABV6JU08_9PROT